jgi:two-component system sensor histidine kinase CpxA
MHSLFLRIFVLFWIAMALIVGGSIAATFALTSHEYESREQQRRPAPIAIQASEVLYKGGLPALGTWLSSNARSIPDREVFIIGPDGKDILGRRLTESALRRLEYFNRESVSEPPPSPQPPTQPAPGNFRPQRAAPQIVGPDGVTYTVISVPRRPSIFGVLSLPGISFMILCIALVVSAFASWWLAQHLSAPIRRIQAGARALAGENLDGRGGAAMRVSAGLEERKDEVAVLARDFDAMADRLIANRAAITRLLRDISHELRSPLARMRLAVGLARRPTADSGRQLDRLEREIERLDDLIGQVLKLARLNGTEAPIRREQFDLDEVIEEVVHDANFEGAAKGCRVTVKGAARRSVNGNRELLRSAIENVLRNAVRYSPPGAPVEVAVESVEGGLAVSIRDRGPGVPAGDLEHIFEPFFRVAESRDRDSGGEGIGLAITSQVMRAHGGWAKAGNRGDGGLEVRLALPPAAPAA